MQTSWDHETERYRFSTAEDLPRFAEMLSDPEVGRWLWFTPAPRETFEQFFAPLVDAQTVALARGGLPGACVFTVEENGTFLGQGASLAVEGSPGGFEIGFQLCRAAWGRGVGTRLARFLCAFVVHAHDAYRIQGSCLEGNLGSRALLEKIGLRLEGTRPGLRLRDGVRHTEMLYGAEVAAMDATAIRATAEAVGLVTVDGA